MLPEPSEASTGQMQMHGLPGCLFGQTHGLPGCFCASSEVPTPAPLDESRHLCKHVACGWRVAGVRVVCVYKARTVPSSTAAMSPDLPYVRACLAEKTFLTLPTWTDGGPALRAVRTCPGGHALVLKGGGGTAYLCTQCGELINCGIGSRLIFCDACDYVRCGACVVQACCFPDYPWHLGSSNVAVENFVLASLISDDVAALGALAES